MRTAIIEAETREEVMQEMEERMQQMEKMYTRRLMKQVSILQFFDHAKRLILMLQVEQNELKMDAKLDMLHRASAIGIAAISPPQTQEEPSQELGDIEEEDEIERSLVSDAPLQHEPTVLDLIFLL